MWNSAEHDDDPSCNQQSVCERKQVPIIGSEALEPSMGVNSSWNGAFAKAWSPVPAGHCPCSWGWSRAALRFGGPMLSMCCISMSKEDQSIENMWHAARLGKETEQKALRNLMKKESGKDREGPIPIVCSKKSCCLNLCHYPIETISAVHSRTFFAASASSVSGHSRAVSAGTSFYPLEPKLRSAGRRSNCSSHQHVRHHDIMSNKTLERGRVAGQFRDYGQDNSASKAQRNGQRWIKHVIKREWNVQWYVNASCWWRQVDVVEVVRDVLRCVSSPRCFH